MNHMGSSMSSLLVYRGELWNERRFAAISRKQAYGAKAGDSKSPTARDIGQTSLMGYFAAASLVESQSTQSQKSLDETEAICLPAGFESR